MASLVLGMVGGYFGGQWGILIGSMAGYAIDTQWMGSNGEDVEGPRMEELRVSSSGYGRPIEKVWGTARVAGNIIWATDIVEEENTEEYGGTCGGGGGTEVTTYSYFGNFAVGICAGPVQMISKVWAKKANL